MNTPTTLTRDHVRMMRQATDVVFRCRDGRNTLEAIKRHNGDYDSEIRADIAVDARLTNYGQDIKGATKVIDAFDMIGSAQWSPRWLTIAQIVRPGDTLRFDWTRNNDSENMRAAGYNRDSLTLVIIRKGKAKTRELHFRVAEYVGPDNTARLIRAVAS